MKFLTCFVYVCVVQCELYHWVDVLDRFDKILSEACQDGQLSPTNSDPTHCVFMCPRLQDEQVGLLRPSLLISSPPPLLPLSLSLQFKRKVVAVLYFTALLVEHSYTRNIYNSTEVKTPPTNPPIHSSVDLSYIIQATQTTHLTNSPPLPFPFLSFPLLLQHLCTLLASSDMDVVLAVLNLLYVFRYSILPIACTVYAS